MQPVSGIEIDKNISLLLKGVPGEGKTVAATTFCIFGDVALFYFDKKVPVEVYTFYKKIGRSDLLDRIHFTAYSSDNCNEYLNDLFKMVKEPGRYAAGITDSVTSLTASAVNWHMGFNSKDKRDSTTIEIPGFDEYKTETSLVTQALDICKAMPWFNIWTAHPLPSLKIEAKNSGGVDTIKTVNHIVSYGQKVGAMVPGKFTEIYHFSRNGGRRTVWTDLIGEDYAKTSYNIPRSFDITDKLFAEVWRDVINRSLQDMEGKKDVVVDPFAQVVAKTSKWKV